MFFENGTICFAVCILISKIYEINKPVVRKIVLRKI